MPSIPSPEPAMSCFDDLDFFKDFENEFPAIVYNDAKTSKSYLLTKPILNPQHIDEFDLSDKTSLSKYDKEEQNVLYVNDLFPFNIICYDDLKSEKDKDDNDIDITQSLLDNEITHGSTMIFETNMALPPCEQRHRFLRYEGLEYTDSDIADFESRFGEVLPNFDSLGTIQFQLGGSRRRLSWRQFILALGLHTGEEMESPGFARFGAGRKSRRHISGGQFVSRLAKHFGLLIAEILRGFTIIAPVLQIIDMAELPPPPPPALAKTMPHRMDRLEEDVHDIHGELIEQREVIDASGLVTFPRIRRVRQRIDEASTFAAQQDP
ncbi:hypothetical protein Tco_0369404 [Tanacetum coccineum]